jgi:hypothetical protein
MTIPEALKELYVALGGDADDVSNMSTNPELIAKIATKVGAGLPEVSAEDNGDVLTVVEGAWGKAKPREAIKIITLTDNSLPTGVTYQTILEDYNNGVLSAIIDKADGANTVCYISTVDYPMKNKIYFTSHKHGMPSGSSTPVDMIVVSKNSSTVERYTSQ